MRTRASHKALAKGGRPKQGQGPASPTKGEYQRGGGQRAGGREAQEAQPGKPEGRGAGGWETGEGRPKQAGRAATKQSLIAYGVRVRLDILAIKHRTLDNCTFLNMFKRKNRPWPALARHGRPRPALAGLGANLSCW